MNEEDTVEPERRREDDMVPPSGQTDAVFLFLSYPLRFGEEDDELWLLSPKSVHVNYRIPLTSFIYYVLCPCIS